MQKRAQLEYRNAVYEGCLREGQRNGAGILLDDDLTFIFSQFQKDAMDGLSLIYSADGKYFYGNFQFDKPHGLCVFRCGDLVLVGRFNQGSLQGKFLTILQHINVLAVIQQHNFQYEITDYVIINSQQTLVTYLQLLEVPKYYYSLTKFLNNLSTKDIKFFPLKNGSFSSQQNSYFGFFNGLGIVFDHNHGVVSVGQYKNQSISIGYLKVDKKHQEGNFQTKQVVLYQYKKRPTTQIHSIYKKMHKLALGFVNKYVQSKNQILNSLEEIIRKNVLIAIEKIQIRKDVNDSLDFKEYSLQNDIVKKRQLWYQNENFSQKKEQYTKNEIKNISQYNQERQKNIKIDKVSGNKQLKYQASSKTNAIKIKKPIYLTQGSEDQQSQLRKIIEQPKIQQNSQNIKNDYTFNKILTTIINQENENLQKYLKQQKNSHFDQNCKKNSLLKNNAFEKQKQITNNINKKFYQPKTNSIYKDKKNIVNPKNDCTTKQSYFNNNLYYQNQQMKIQLFHQQQEKQLKRKNGNLIYKKNAQSQFKDISTKKIQKLQNKNEDQHNIQATGKKIENRFSINNNDNRHRLQKNQYFQSQLPNFRQITPNKKTDSPIRSIRKTHASPFKQSPTYENIQQRRKRILQSFKNLNNQQFQSPALSVITNSTNRSQFKYSPLSIQRQNNQQAVNNNYIPSLKYTPIQERKKNSVQKDSKYQKGYLQIRREMKQNTKVDKKYKNEKQYNIIQNKKPYVIEKQQSSIKKREFKYTFQ